ncbi:hypothetical protein GPECTOR_119g399 [Gonium pectorale]|uniref:Exocyst complex component Sec8 n=1 Tax=Gonium pectorale TaxID=33097 RepID=A0A150FYV6_GONPE|nr:hypothetical protein GPECTOR_119g399 [Gonium pectorale]|eukprot:KXZ42768.1 hypothetical protein GPECTOR_119g399 [Gonium pectorale]
MAGGKEAQDDGSREKVDWKAVDKEISAVPAEYREIRFHPLKHVVEVFSSRDPQGLTQELRNACERLGYQLDAVVEGYHAGFARSIQNYSQILQLFEESKQQVESLKRSLADAAKQLGTHSKTMNSQWRKTVSLESSLRLLADVRTLVEVPARIDMALAERDWPRAVSCLLEGSTLLAHEELRRMGALRKLRSDMVSLAGWIQDQMMDELTARIYSNAHASTSSAEPSEPGTVADRLGVLGAAGAAAGKGGGRGKSSATELASRGPLARVRSGRDIAAGLPQHPGGRRPQGQAPAYKLVTEALQSSRTASTELRTALSAPMGGLAAPGGAAGAGAGAAAAAGRGGKGSRPGAGGPGGDIMVDVDGAMRHVSTRDLVACLAQVDCVVEAKQHVAQKAEAEMRALIRRSVEAFMQASWGAGDARALPSAAADAALSGQGSVLGPSTGPALRVLTQRLVTHVAGTCIQALGRMQHVLVALANAPATTQSSALDVLGGLRGRDGVREGLLDGRGRHRAAGTAGRAGGGGGLTARERAAYLREEYQKAWDCMQEELQQLIAEVLKTGDGWRRPGQKPARGDKSVGSNGPAGEAGALGGVRGLLSDLNPVHFLEHLAALAEKTADMAESALGGGSATPAAPAGSRAQQLQRGQAPGGKTGSPAQGGALVPAPRRPAGTAAGIRLTFGFDVTVTGLSGEGAGSLQLLTEVYLPVLRLVGRAEEVLRLPPDLEPGGAGAGQAAGQGQGSFTEAARGVTVVTSWLPAFLDDVALEQLLPQLWVDLRGRCTAALEDPDAFRPQVGFGAATASAAAGPAAGASAGSTAGSQPDAGGGAADGSAAATRSVVPIARFIEGVLRELLAAAKALPPFKSAFLAIAERILDRMLGAFTHMVRLWSSECHATRLVSRSDVCMAMASEADAPLLREPIAFAPQPHALPGSSASGPGGQADLVGFLVSLRSQERPLLVPPQLRPLASAGGGGGGGGRAAAHGFGADGDAAEAELHYFAMRERPVGHERLLFGQGSSERSVHLSAMSESLDFVADAVVRIATAAEGGSGAGDAAGGGGAAGGRRGWRAARQAKAEDGSSSASIPDLLLPVVQSYRALAGHCCRLLRLEGLLLVASHLAPVAAASHVCHEGEDSLELHPSLGALTRAALRSAEELSPYLQPTKRAYVFGPMAAATARGIMWLLPAIHDINSLGVERMIRALSVLQPPLTTLVSTGGSPAGPTSGLGPGGSAATPSMSAGSDLVQAAAVAEAAAAAATALPPVSGVGASAAVVAALLMQPETRGERGRMFDRARAYYGLLLVPADEVVRAAGERPGRFLYAEWMALLQAHVPHRTVTDVTVASLQRCLDRAHGLTPGAKVAEVVGAVVGAVQAPAERLGDALLEGLVAGKDTVVDVLMAGKDTLVAGVRVPAQTLQRVFKRIGGAAVAGVRERAARRGGRSAEEGERDAQQDF